MHQQTKIKETGEEEKQQLANRFAIARNSIAQQDLLTHFHVGFIACELDMMRQLQNQLLDHHFDNRSVRVPHHDQRANHRRLQRYAVLRQRRQQRAQELVQLRLDRLAENGKDLREQLRSGQRHDFGGKIRSGLIG